MKNLMAYLSQPKVQEGFQARQMEHTANNPIHEAHLQKALAMHSPKTKMQSPQPSNQPGSPWLAMGVKK